jgi:hypothetical protein
VRVDRCNAVVFGAGNVLACFVCSDVIACRNCIAHLRDDAQSEMRVAKKYA